MTGPEVKDMMHQPSKQTMAREVSSNAQKGGLDPVSRTDAAIYGAKPGFVIERYSARSSIPLADSKALLLEYAQMMHRRVTDAGGPDFDYTRHVDAFLDGLDDVLSPKGSYLLVRDMAGQLIGMAALRRVSHDTGEMKHLYIRPNGRRSGLGEALVRARMEDARTLGLRWLIADTFKINPELPALYGKLGFQIVPPSGTSKSTSLSPEIEDAMWFYRYDLRA